MGCFYEHTEPDDPMDSPRYEAEYNQEKQQYWEYLEDRERWSE